MTARWIGPLAAGLISAGATFAIVALADDDAGRRRDVTVIAGQGDSSSGRAIFARMGCGSCHRLAAAGSSGRMGPDLDLRLPAHDRASLVGVITDSDRSGAFAAMPEDFGRRMNTAELNALVRFLLAAGNLPRSPH